MKFTKNFFNMVEIVLALSIVAIALVSLMGVLPVALRAGKDTVSEANSTPTVNIVKTLIDSVYNDVYYSDDSSKRTEKFDGGSGSGAFLENFIGNKNVAKLDDDLKNKLKFDSKGASKIAVVGAGYLDFSDKSKRQFSDDDMEKYAFQITQEKNNAGIYLFEQFSGKFDKKTDADNKDGEFENIDSAMDVRIWYTMFSGFVYVPYDVTDSTKFKNNILTNMDDNSANNLPIDHACTFHIQISYPSGVPYDQQEHKIYKFDYFRQRK